MQPHAPKGRLSMNHQHVSLLVLLDLSSAFDTIDHTILRNRLQPHFGMCDYSLSWFESYLSDRTQFVSIKGPNSSNIPVHHGVPQGSCLGLLLFSLYTCPLFELIRSHIHSMHCYADNVQVYLSFKPDYYIYNIRRTRKSLFKRVCETLVNALFTSRLDYS